MGKAKNKKANQTKKTNKLENATHEPNELHSRREEFSMFCSWALVFALYAMWFVTRKYHTLYIHISNERQTFRLLARSRVCVCATMHFIVCMCLCVCVCTIFNVFPKNKFSIFRIVLTSSLSRALVLRRFVWFELSLAVAVCRASETNGARVCLLVRSGTLTRITTN